MLELDAKKREKILNFLQAILCNKFWNYLKSKNVYVRGTMYLAVKIMIQKYPGMIKIRANR